MSVNLTSAAYGGNTALSKAGLAATAGQATVSTANTLTYAVKGQLYSQAAVAAAAYNTDIGTNKPFVPLAIGQTAIVAAFINAAGALGFAQGPAVATLDFQGGLAAAQFPQADDSRTPFGYFLITSSAAAASPWTFGTSAQGATGINIIARDVMNYPAQPITG